MTHLTMGGVVLLLLCAAGTRAQAQEVASSFEQLAVLVKSGDKVTVVDVNGAETKGRIGKLSRERLTLVTPAGLRELGEVDVGLIRQRRDDSLRNGAIIGAVAGTACYVTLAAIFAQISDGGEMIVSTAVIGGLIYAGLGAAAGVGIDALITRRQVIYRKGPGGNRVSVAPLLGHGRRGAIVRVTF